MGPEAEGEVFAGVVAVGVEHFGAGEFAVVPVRRPEADQNHRLGRDRGIADSDLAGGLAEKHLNRRLEAQRLLDQRGDHAGVAPDFGHQFRVAQQVQHHRVHQAGGRFVAGHQQYREEAQQLLVVQRGVAVRPGRHEVGE